MEECSVSTLLEEWQLSHLIKSFEEHGIVTLVLLIELQESHIKELIPKIKDRIIFEQERNKFIQNISVPLDSSTPVVPLLIPPFDLLAEPVPSSSNTVSTASGSSSSTTSSTATLSFSSASDFEDQFAVSFVNTDNTVLKNEDNSLKRKLQNDIEGLEIIASAKRHMLSRKKLVNFVINKELQGDIDKRITSNRFNELADEIIQLFPQEKKAIYYIPFHKENGRRILAKGKLWDKYCNKRRALKVLGLITSIRSSENEALNDTDEDIVPELEEQLIFLQNNVTPWENITKFWKSTALYRMKRYALLDGIHGILKKYPAIRQPRAYELIDIDFTALYPDQQNNLFTTWPPVAQKIIDLVIKKKNNLGNIIIKNNSQYKDSNNIVPFLVLANYLTISKLKNCNWRPSKIECQDGFLLHVKKIEDLQTTLEERKEKLLKLKLTTQPLPIIVGTDVDNIIANYVSINNELLKLESPLKAIDICFKSFFALNAKYPLESEHLWTFIQKYIYNIDTNCDTNFISVNTLVSDLS